MRLFWFFLLGAAFLSCSGNEEDNQDQGSTQMTISYWEYMDPSIDDHLDFVLEDFSLASGYAIQREHIEPTQLRDAFIQDSLTGGGPDFVIVPSDHVGSIRTTETGLPAHQVFSPDFFQRFAPEALSYTTLGGEILGIPLLLGNTVILFYNTDLIDAPPENWDELIALAKEHTDKEADQWGLTYNLASSFFFAPFYGAFGGQMFEEGTSVPSLDNQAMAQALNFVYDLKFKHEILTPRTDSPSANRYFSTGKAAFLINGPWVINQFLGKVPFALTPLPAIGNRIPRPLISTGTIVLNKNLEAKPEKLEAVKELIEFLTDQETQVELALIARELPSVSAAQEDPRLMDDPFVEPFVRQIQRGVPMPSIIEMRFVFQSIRGSLEEVIFGDSDFQGAAKRMQESALNLIEEFSQ